MSTLLDALRNFAAWWHEGLAAAGAHASLEQEPLNPGNPETDPEADREAWEEERARLALSPWWL
jgi:hypothetical protein